MNNLLYNNTGYGVNQTKTEQKHYTEFVYIKKCLENLTVATQNIHTSVRTSHRCISQMQQ